jgi:RNA polymerase sigma-70 factor (ECF subfamily)
MSRELKGRIDPEDVAQEVLLAVHGALDRFDPRAPQGFMPWLFTVAENRVRDLAKHFGARKRQPTEEVLRRTHTSPSSFAARAEELERMRAALERLPPAHAEILRLRDLEERSYAEIARLSGRTEVAARVLHFRALAALRDALEGSGT